MKKIQFTQIIFQNKIQVRSKFATKKESSNIKDHNPKHKSRLKKHKMKLTKSKIKPQTK